MKHALLRRIDAVTVRAPDLDSGIAFYVDRLGHTLNWRNDDIGSAGLALPESDAEIVLTTEHGYEPNWLVEPADDALEPSKQQAARCSRPRSTSPSGELRSSPTLSATCSC